MTLVRVSHRGRASGTANGYHRDEPMGPADGPGEWGVWGGRSPCGPRRDRRGLALDVSSRASRRGTETLVDCGDVDVALLLEPLTRIASNDAIMLPLTDMLVPGAEPAPPRADDVERPRGAAVVIVARVQLFVFEDAARAEIQREGASSSFAKRVRVALEDIRVESGGGPAAAGIRVSGGALSSAVR